MAKPALGTGLSALIGAKGKLPRKAVEASAAESPPVAVAESGEQVRRVPLEQISPSPLQPRRHFSEAQLEELVESIREHGVIQPLIVRMAGGRLELIAGERRWRACRRLELAEVPVIVREASDRDVLELALIENLQREDLNPIEEADAYRRLAREFELRQEDIARKVGRSRAAVANAMRLLDLDHDVQSLLAQGRISVGHAKVLLALKDPEAQRRVAEETVRRSLTVRAAEQAVAAILNPRSSAAPRPGSGGSVSPAIAGVENRLREHFATHVRLQHGDRKGRIEIEYYGNDDLQRILDLLGLSAEEF